jgi:hypothetical protein
LPASLEIGKATKNLRLTEPEPLPAGTQNRSPSEYAGSMTEVTHTNEGDGRTDQGNPKHSHWGIGPSCHT